jgi:dTDP-4-dehydrorhamnose 3,5-epimerase
VPDWTSAVASALQGLRGSGEPRALRAYGAVAPLPAAFVPEGVHALGRANVKAVVGVLHGTIVFESTTQLDEQGSVACTFDAEVADSVGLHARGLVQECQTRTRRGGVRGLHLRTDGGEGKLVRCTSGSVVDVAVDLRPSSPTYRLWMTVILDDVEHRSVWLPAGLAHGYQALTEAAAVVCRANRIHRPEYEATIRYDDPDLGIPWPMPVTGLTARDNAAPPLAVIEPMLDDWFGGLT